jgi:TonB family protein
MQNINKFCSVLFLAALFPAAHAQQPPPSSDIRCLIVSMQMSTMTDTPRRTAGNMALLYYFGRLDPFPPKAIEEALTQQLLHWTQTDFNTEGERCGKELTERTQRMSEIGDSLVPRGSDLEEKPHATTTPPKANPAPPVAPPTPATTAAATGRTPVKPDPNHPLRIGEEFYPPESRRLQEEGICVVGFEVDPDGHIRATQLLSSSGFPRLNEACLAGFANGRLIPATVDGKPVAAWISIPVTWKLNGKTFTTTPQIRHDYQLKIGPDDYPPISRKLHQEGDCVVHVDVGLDGRVSHVAVTKSAGFEPLDQACVSAIEQAPFIPAQRDGLPVAASTDINISWRFPWPETPAQ